MKFDIGFALDNATWPAFVVDPLGNVRHANEAAVNTFGAVIETFMTVTGTFTE